MDDHPLRNAALVFSCSRRFKRFLKTASTNFTKVFFDTCQRHLRSSVLILSYLVFDLCLPWCLEIPNCNHKWERQDVKPADYSKAVHKRQEKALTD
jgi:hypothetical protein